MTDLASLARDQELRFLLISFTDLFGMQRAKLVPASAIAAMGRDGAGFAGFAAWLDLSPAGAKVIAQAQPFYALNTWSLPALSHGLLYVRQQQKDLMQKTGERVICLDLRGE